MTKTENYQLNQWEPADPIRRTDFNADNAAIDAAIKAVADTANGKADSADLAALEQSVAAQLVQKGNCRITWGYYEGTGECGSDNPVTLSFDFRPVLVIVGGNVNTSSTSWPTLMLRGIGSGRGTTGYNSIVTWLDAGVRWYHNSDVTTQNNMSGYKYYYIAIGYDE